MNRLCIFAAALLLLPACSTILDRSTQEVRFETPGAKESMCRVTTGKEGVSYRVHPPEEIILMKTDQQLEVECLADGHRKRTVLIEPVLSSNTFLNFGNGFVPGFALDEHTNAHYVYPDVIAVDFSNIPFKKAEQPAYAVNPSAPSLEHIDPTTGSFPAIHDSDLEPPAPLSERQSKITYSDNQNVTQVYSEPLPTEPVK